MAVIGDLLDLQDARPICDQGRCVAIVVVSSFECSYLVIKYYLIREGVRPSAWGMLMRFLRKSKAERLNPYVSSFVRELLRGEPD